MMEVAAVVEKGFAPELLETAETVASGLRDLRRAAFARFEELGFPTPKNEEWRFTGLQPITGTPWAPAHRPPRLGSLPPDGVRVRSLADAFSDVKPHLAKIALYANDAFVALNTACLEDGVVLEIARGAVIERPIEIAFEAAPASRPEVSHPRLLILAGARSQATVIETYEGEGRYFTNAVTEIALSEGALLDHYKLQRESETACHVHTVSARQERSSRLVSHNVALGSALARTDLRVCIGGEGAECALNGLFVGRGSQHLDNHTTIDHARPHGTSRELYKGIMDGASRGVFHGKIIVRPDAQKTDAVQTNKNLLLSRQALVNSTPALEIFADDVKCKHGSTTGQLDPAALFYLRSRGIGEEDARSLLTWAFASEVTDRMRVSWIRAEVERELRLRLSGAPGEAIR